MTLAKRAEDLFNALFCYGEEPWVGFSLTNMAASLGTTEKDIGARLQLLKVYRRIDATIQGDDCTARQVWDRGWNGAALDADYRAGVEAGRRPRAQAAPSTSTHTSRAGRA